MQGYSSWISFLRTAHHGFISLAFRVSFFPNLPLSVVKEEKIPLHGYRTVTTPHCFIGIRLPWRKGSKRDCTWEAKCSEIHRMCDLGAPGKSTFDVLIYSKPYKPCTGTVWPHEGLSRPSPPPRNGRCCFWGWKHSATNKLLSALKNQPCYACQGNKGPSKANISKWTEEKLAC